MKILIIGESRHGKDQLAEFLEEVCGITHKSSSVAAAEAIFPRLQDATGNMYFDAKHAFVDRQDKKHLWKQFISEYNTPDKARLCREILQEVDIYVGMRCPEEYAASRPLFDHVFFVDAGERVGYPPTTTMGIEFDPVTMRKVDNNGTLDDLRRYAEAIAVWYGLGRFAA